MLRKLQGRKPRRLRPIYGNIRAPQPKLPTMPWPKYAPAPAVQMHSWLSLLLLQLHGAGPGCNAAWTRLMYFTVA